MIPGGNYHAAQNLDGTWDVFDVPVCSEGEIPRYGRAGEVVDHWPATREWFEKIIKTNATREKTGFLGRLHIHHHDDGDRVEEAGYIRPRRVGTVEDIDEAGSVFVSASLNCDLIHIPEWTYMAIRAGQLPYRSIECNDCESAFLDSVALMPTKAPFFKLPMLTIGSEESATDKLQRADVPSRNIQDAAHPIAARAGLRLVASRSYGKHVQALARFDNMDDDTKPADDKPDADAKASALPDLSTLTVDQLSELMALVKEALAKLQPEGDDDTADVDPGPADSMAAAKAKPDAAAAAAAAKNTALETRVSVLENTQAVDKQVKAGMKALEGYAIGTPSVFEPKLRAHLEKYGPESLDDFVQIHKDTCPKADQDDVEGDPIRVAAGVAPGEDLSDAVLEYTDAEEQAVAARASAMWKSGQETGHTKGTKEEDFVRRAVARAKRTGKVAIT